MRWLIAGGLLLATACAMLIVGAKIDNAVVSAGGFVVVLCLLGLRTMYLWWGAPAAFAVQAGVIACLVAVGAVYELVR